MKNIYFIAIFILFVSCNLDKKDSLFSVSTNNGLNFINKITNTDSLNILNYLYFYNGAGVAVADFNNDGLDDIYFTSNLEEDALYLNKGNLKFQDVTSLSNITNDKGWTTGVTTVDINNDGLMDIYISKVSNHLHLQGHNLLYINQGLKNNVPFFEEQSKIYGLDFSGLTTQATFFDFDLDGDLDVYLLNHSVYPNSNYGRGSLRKSISEISGDKLYKNENGLFTDVTKSSGIYQSKIGYGLGVSVGDVNNDGYPDIYIGNDFFENDYLYINMKNGTFKEMNSYASVMSHTSHFTMGTDISDINNDGFQDIFTLDMLPENLETLKASGTEYPYPIYQNRLKNGYEPQFMQNTLHLNNGNMTFSESAFASNIAATEWSWSPLISDFDNDGFKDIYITNGIIGATNDMDFVNFIANESIQKKLSLGIDKENYSIIKAIPSKKITNYLFINKKNNTFQNETDRIDNNQKTYSSGASYSDLDNDGDIDIVINNSNSRAIIVENKSSVNTNSNYLKIKFLGSDQNNKGIGAKVTSYSKNNIQFFENYTTRGYLSAVPPEVFIGVDSILKLDSLKITWPRGKTKVYYNVPLNRTITVKETEATHDIESYSSNDRKLLTHTHPLLNSKHEENPSLDFANIPLTPYGQSRQSRIIEVGDINNDGLDDILTLGAKNHSSKIHYQEHRNSQPYFNTLSLPDNSNTSLYEDIDAIIFDANTDGQSDILIVSGGNEFLTGEALQPRLYIRCEDGFIRKEDAFDTVEINASSVTKVDINNDGYFDVCITSGTEPQSYGKTSKQFIFKNDGLGNFKDITEEFGGEFIDVGNVRDIVWRDLDNNGYKDAIVVGHWMPITIFLNDGNQLYKVSDNELSQTSGWWNTIITDDFDNDGDIDIVAGNWGLNSKLRASVEEPMKLYLGDFDNNGTTDPVITYFYKGQETTLASKDELAKQLPHINKKFLSYNAFAKASVKDIIGKEALRKSKLKNVQTLASTYFENDGKGRFKSKQLPFKAQLSPIYGLQVDDFNKDGYNDFLVVGNESEISTQLGKLDASHGTIFLNDKKGFFVEHKNQSFNILGNSRTIKAFHHNNKKYYLIGRNSDTLLFLKKTYD